MDRTAGIIDFTLVFNRFKVRLYNYVLKMTGSRMVSEDIVQDVFLKLFENLNGIRNAGSINYWLFRSARNEIYMYFRSRKSNSDKFNVGDINEMDIRSGIDLNEKLELGEIKELIEKELNTMQDDQREVFILKEYGGLSYSEIASIMNIDVKLVKSRLFKTRQKLINKLAGIIR